MLTNEGKPFWALAMLLSFLPLWVRPTSEAIAHALILLTSA